MCSVVRCVPSGTHGIDVSGTSSRGAIFTAGLGLILSGFRLGEPRRPIHHQHPLFKQLQAQPGSIGGPPSWNFTKYLVDRTGNVIARYESRVKPDDATMVGKIKELLAAK